MLNRISAHAPRPAGRHRARPRRRRLAATAPGLTLITIAALAALVALAGCSSGASSSGSDSGAASGHVGSVAAPPAALGPAASSSASAASAASASSPESGAGNGASAAAGTSTGMAGSGGEGGGAGGEGGGAAQATADRSIAGDQQLVYTAELAVRAKNVGAALATATSIVTAAGGYVSAENTSGAGAGAGSASGSGSGAAASQATADVTLKVPAAVYPATLAKLTGAGLGTQLSLQQQAQDVTQQVADVSSLVASDQAAITQLRALLKDAGSVGSLLVVQDQINTETSNLESMLAQQQALDRETSYATVTLTLVGPKPPVKAKARHRPVPPPGLASGLTGGWRAFRLTVDWLLAIVGAVAPFVAIVVVIAGGAWWVRRRVGRGAGAAEES